MNTSTSAGRTCPKCGASLSGDVLDGLCPACLMGLNAAEATRYTGEEGEAAVGSSAPPPVAEIAALFPQLEIAGLIGRGGMGAVYKARQKELDRFVGLKVLPPGIGRDPAFSERFAREARALARLNHPNIVTLYEFGRAGAQGPYYFLMEFVDGVNLRQLLRAGRVEPREALAIVPQICDALQYAHDQGIVHRDIKPENILLDRQGRVKVADFGLARIVEGRAGSPLPADEAPRTARSAVPTVTQAGLVMGTPHYMAPEQRDRPTDVDHRADIYSLGVVFYQMLTGELPDRKFQPPSKKVVIDVRLDEVVMRAMETKPELRYQQVSEVKTMIETISRNREPASPPVPAWSPRRLLWTVVIVHLIGLFVLMVMLMTGVPKFEAMFKDFGVQLPMLTRLVFTISRVARFGGLLAGFALAALLTAMNWGICWLAQRLGGRKLLAAWGILGFLGVLWLTATVVAAVFLPLRATEERIASASLDVSAKVEMRGSPDQVKRIEAYVGSPGFRAEVESRAESAGLKSCWTRVHRYKDTSLLELTAACADAQAAARVLEIMIAALKDYVGGNRLGEIAVIEMPNAPAVDAVPVETPLAFGPEMDHSLAFNTNGQTDAVGLESNDVIRLPYSGGALPEVVGFLNDADDASLFVQSGLFQTHFLPVSGKQWDALSGSDCVERVTTARGLMGAVMVRKSDLPAHFLFHTSSGRVGALRVAASAGEEGVKARIKLVTQAGTNAVFPSRETTGVRPAGSYKPIPPEATKSFNESRELWLEVMPCFSAPNAATSILAMARNTLRQEEVRVALDRLLEGTAAAEIQRYCRKKYLEMTRVNPGTDRDAWLRAQAEQQIAGTRLECLMAEAGAADFISPDARTAKFGPWTEAVLLPSSAGTNCCIDFDTGKILTPPADILAAMPEGEVAWMSLDSSAQETNILVRWIRHNGVDAIGLTPSNVLVFAWLQTSISEADPGLDRQWIEQLSPAWLLWKLYYHERTLRAAGQDGTAAEFAVCPANSPVMTAHNLCIFRTQAGMMGLLQVLGLDAGGGARIRYRMVQPPGDGAPVPPAVSSGSVSRPARVSPVVTASPGKVRDLEAALAGVKSGDRFRLADGVAWLVTARVKDSGDHARARTVLLDAVQGEKGPDLWKRDAKG